MRGPVAAGRDQAGHRDDALECPFKGALFERVVLSPEKVSPVGAQTHPGAAKVSRDSYLFEFLALPPGRSEADLYHCLLSQLQDFLIELGCDFCFVGSEFPLQAGRISRWICFSSTAA